jgi:hypothetical protein
MPRQKEVRIGSQSDKINIADVDAKSLICFLNHDCTKRSHIMSDSVGTKNTPKTNEATTPSLGVKRSFSWASDVKPPREGGMRMGAKWVPQKKKELVPDDTSKDERQHDGGEGGEHGNESEEEEVDDEADRGGNQLNSQQSQGSGGSRNGTNTTITQHSPSAATASQTAISRLPIEPDFDASQWGAK